METNVVRVKLWDMTVGYLAWNKRADIATFEYDLNFLKWGLDIAPLTMSITAPRSQKSSIGKQAKLFPVKEIFLKSLIILSLNMTMIPFTLLLKNDTYATRYPLVGGW
jgi:hypothetical protein